MFIRNEIPETDRSIRDSLKKTSEMTLSTTVRFQSHSKLSAEHSIVIAAVGSAIRPPER